MQKGVKKTITWAIATLMLLGFGILTTMQVANAQENDSSKQVRIEVLPEIYVNRDTNDIFHHARETIGANATMSVYGSFHPTQEKVKEIWNNVAFHVYDEDGKLIETTKGTLGASNRWSGAKYLGPYPQGAAYTIQVDKSTIPSGYHTWFTALKSDLRKQDAEKSEVMTVSTDHASATNVKEDTNPIAEVRFHMQVLNIAYAKNADVAKDLIMVDGRKVTGINPKYKEGQDYLITAIDKDSKVTLPPAQDLDKLASEGYMPNGFHYIYTDEETNKSEVMPLSSITIHRGNFEYLRWEVGNDSVNTMTKFAKGRVFTVILDQKIPEVKFYKKSVDGADPDLLTSIQVYYKHSLAQNCLSDGTTCLEKTLPTAPNPAKEGYVFKEWNTKADGSGVAFNADTAVMQDLAVYPIYVPNTPPVLEVKDATITAGENLDFLSLVTKAADAQDGPNLLNQVKVDAGDFSNAKPGTYEIKFTLTDKNGASVSAVAKVTVKAAAAKKPQLPQTGFAGSALLGAVLTLSGAGAIALRKSRAYKNA